MKRQTFRSATLADIYIHVEEREDDIQAGANVFTNTRASGEKNRKFIANDMSAIT